MKLYCKNNVILAWHDDDQDVPASKYGDDVEVVQVTSWTDLPSGLITNFGTQANIPEES
jgi:hypothetical protein